MSHSSLLRKVISSHWKSSGWECCRGRGAARALFSHGGLLAQGDGTGTDLALPPQDGNLGLEGCPGVLPRVNFEINPRIFSPALQMRGIAPLRAA